MQFQPLGPADARSSTAGTPAITLPPTSTTATDVDTITSRPGPTPLCVRPAAPSSTPLLTDAATAAGAQVRFGAGVTGLVRDDRGAVTGVQTTSSARTRDHGPRPGPLVDRCRRSSLHRGRAVQAPLRARRGGSSSAVLYGYWSGLDASTVPLVLPARCDRRVIPTNDGQACVWPGCPRPRRFDERCRGDLDDRLPDACWPRPRPSSPPERTDTEAPARPRLPRRPGYAPPRHRARLGAGRRRRLLQGPAHRARHHRRPARRRAACPRTARRWPGCARRLPADARPALAADLARRSPTGSPPTRGTSPSCAICCPR